MNCKCCGKEDSSESFLDCEEKKVMEEMDFCFSCAFWEIHARNWEKGINDNIYFINGTRYHDCGIVDKSKMRWPIGYGGADFIIKRLDNDKIIKTNNLWCQGDVPTYFKSRLPDNAEFLRPTHAVLYKDSLIQFNVFRGLWEDCWDFLLEKVDRPVKCVYESYSIIKLV